MPLISTFVCAKAALTDSKEKEHKRETYREDMKYPVTEIYPKASPHMLEFDPSFKVAPGKL